MALAKARATASCALHAFAHSCICAFGRYNSKVDLHGLSHDCTLDEALVGGLEVGGVNEHVAVSVHAHDILGMQI